MVKDNMKEYADSGFRVYLAGPFFNEEQEERIDYIEDLLDSLGYDIFSPRQASKIKPGATTQDMLDTFKGNVTHIDDCDFMLAILDSNDSGTLFETGYAYSKNKPILYFNETRPKDKGPNLMLALSGRLPFVMNTDDKSARDELKDILTSMMDKGLLDTIKETKNVFNEVE